MDEFNDLYGDNILNADRRRVDLLESRFDREDDPSAKKWAKKFEAMMSGCISDHMWFGGNAEMIHTCRFDDYINGIDGILHIKDLNRDSVIALGVDVTSARFEVLGAKFRRIVEELRSGRLAEIKYFRIEGFKGKKENIPRIILGAEHDTVENLYNNWLDGGSHLNKHWVQFQLLEMAIIQCRAFMEFARKNGFDLAGGYIWS